MSKRKKERNILQLFILIFNNSKIKKLDRKEDTKYKKEIKKLLHNSKEINEEYDKLNNIIKLIDKRIEVRNNFLNRYKHSPNIKLCKIKYYDKYDFFVSRFSFLKNYKDKMNKLLTLEENLNNSNTLQCKIIERSNRNYILLEEELHQSFLKILRIYNESRDKYADDLKYLDILKDLVEIYEDDYNCLLNKRDYINKLLYVRFEDRINNDLYEDDILFDIYGLIKEQYLFIVKNDDKDLKKVDEEILNLNNSINIVSNELNLIDTNKLYIDYNKIKENNYNILFKYVCLITSIFIICYGLYNLYFWKIDSNNTFKEIDDINSKVVIEETINNENIEIINNNDSIEKDNPYWDYIKMNLVNVDFTELKKKNNEINSWIKVEGTNINYPVVKTSDNDYYLTHSLNGEYNDAGWVFMDYRNNFEDKNTIIYAHSRLDKTMFGSLSKALSKSWQSNRNNHVIRMSNEKENTLWQIFSVYHIPTTSDYLQINFDNDDEFLSWISLIKERSFYNFTTNIGSNDKILTLSTCYSETEKTVVHAKLIKRETK